MNTMGVAFYPVFENGSGEWPDDIDGVCLARVSDQFDKSCKKASLPTLYDFYSMTRDAMIVELLDGDPDDPSSFDETKIPPEGWFDPAIGLRTVQFLILHLQSNTESFSDSKSVREDLEAFEKKLQEAVLSNTRWHLVVYD